ncbi:hypothetical protein ABZP36_014449 [Zizania latifolia]
MSASNFGNSMEWGRGRSFGSRKGKKPAGNSSSDKPKQPQRQRGLGVAQLEKIRIQSEMAGYVQHPGATLSQPPPIHGIGSLHLEDARSSSNSLSSSPSSSFHANINVSSSYPVHPNLLTYICSFSAMAYGGSRPGDIRYGEFQSTSPIIRSPPNHEATYGAAAHCYRSRPSNDDPTLPLFEPGESIFLRRYHSLNQSDNLLASINSDDPEDVDLELKL